MLFPDIEAGRKESQVPVWRHEYRQACNTSTQAEEEGQQDGLNYIQTPFHLVCSSFPVIDDFALLFHNAAGYLVWGSGELG
jgi:hypothetical protein